MKRRLKIAFVHQPWSMIHPPVSETGVGDSIGLLTDEIARRLAGSHEVIEYCPLFRGQPAAEQFDGVEYRRVPVAFDHTVARMMQRIDRIVWQNARRPFISSPLCYRRFLGEIIMDLSRQNCDIVHVHNFSQFAPLLRARLPKTHIVLHMHCQWLTQLDAAMIEKRINAVDLVLGVSDFIAGGVRRRFPALAQRCRHLHNGVDLTRFAAASHGVPRQPKRILFVGRLSPEKGVHVLLDAFRIVLQHYPDTHLELIGPDSVQRYAWADPSRQDPLLLAIETYFRYDVYMELLRTKIAELPPGSVSVIKGKKFAELLPHYYSASIFVHPSVWNEPCAMPLAEAMAASLPVVATRSGGTPEIIEDGRTGLLVDRADVHALADAILLLLSNPELRTTLAGAAYERASTLFSWDRVVENLLEEYGRLSEGDENCRSC